MKTPQYRVWDKVEKKMIEVTTLVWDNGKIRQVNGWINAITSGRFILMEYTGLKDRNNHKIYERDIIQIKDEYQCYKRIIRWDNEIYMWVAQGKKLYIACGIGWYKKDNGYTIEIIGNDCENPELIGEIT